MVAETQDKLVEILGMLQALENRTYFYNEKYSRVWAVLPALQRIQYLVT